MYKDKNQLNLIDNVHLLTYDESKLIDDNGNPATSIRNIGAFYWLASAANNTELYDVHGGAWLENWWGKINSNYQYCWGIRPVVTMKDGVYISSGTGTETDPYILAKE